jgi:integrase
MARKGLTAISIENMKPDKVRREIPDGKARGLYLVLQPSGHRSWCVRYRRPQDGKPAKLTLGNGGMTLAEARKAAADAMLEIERGRDPGRAKEAARAKLAAAKADTLVAVAEEYLGREGPKLRTFPQRRSTFERLIYPALGSKPIGDVKRSDVVRLLDYIEDHHGPRAADEALGALRRMMNWHASRSDEFRTPIVRGMQRAKPATERARTRILSDDELRAVWKAAGEMGVHGSYIKFLLLTGARRSEASAMRWSELSDTDWALPAARNKTKQDLVRPLSQAALAVLASVPKVAGSDFIFSITGHAQLVGLWEMKQRLDALSGVTGWRIHDLRRTARSLMSRAGVQSDHAEQVLGHVLPGVRGVYDRYNFYDEKKHALEALARQIERIVNPPQDNIVPLHG